MDDQINTPARESKAAPFFDSRNVNLGGARVIWATSTVDAAGVSHAEGWVLPGGERTVNRERVASVARLIARATRAAA